MVQESLKIKFLLIRALLMEDALWGKLQSLTKQDKNLKACLVIMLQSKRICSTTMVTNSKVI